MQVNDNIENVIYCPKRQVKRTVFRWTQAYKNGSVVSCEIQGAQFKDLGGFKS